MQKAGKGSFEERVENTRVPRDHTSRSALFFCSFTFFPFHFYWILFSVYHAGKCHGRCILLCCRAKSVFSAYNAVALLFKTFLFWVVSICFLSSFALICFVIHNLRILPDSPQKFRILFVLNFFFFHIGKRVRLQLLFHFRVRSCIPNCNQSILRACSSGNVWIQMIRALLDY